MSRSALAMCPGYQLITGLPMLTSVSAVGGAEQSGRALREAVAREARALHLTDLKPTTALVRRNIERGPRVVLAGFHERCADDLSTAGFP